MNIEATFLTIRTQLNLDKKNWVWQNPNCGRISFYGNYIEAFWPDIPKDCNEIWVTLSTNFMHDSLVNTIKGGDEEVADVGIPKDPDYERDNHWGKGRPQIIINPVGNIDPTLLFALPYFDQTLLQHLGSKLYIQIRTSDGVVRPKQPEKGRL